LGQENQHKGLFKKIVVRSIAMMAKCFGVSTRRALRVPQGTKDKKKTKLE
jgi:hypothetical protein